MRQATEQEIVEYLKSRGASRVHISMWDHTATWYIKRFQYCGFVDDFTVDSDGYVHHIES